MQQRGKNHPRTDQLLELFVPHFSEEGSNECTTEEVLVHNFCKMLEECEDRTALFKCIVTFALLLVSSSQGPIVALLVMDSSVPETLNAKNCCHIWLCSRWRVIKLSCTFKGRAKVSRSNYMSGKAIVESYSTRA